MNEQYEVFSLTALRHFVQQDESAFEILTSADPTSICRDVALLKLDMGDTRSVRCWITESDTPSTRRIVMRLNEDFRALTPRQANRIIDRCYNFVELCAQARVFIPHNWNSFLGDDDMFMFFAAQKGLVPWKPRWTARRLGKSNDVLFWDLYSADENRKIEDEIVDTAVYDHVVNNWNDLVSRGLALLRGTASTHEDEVHLTSVHRTDSPRPRSYDDWMEEGQLAPDQRRFVLQDGEGSVRLKGPAGSGKTLALEVKALREALRLSTNKKDPRILFATHSNAMRQQVQEDLYGMDSNGTSALIEVAPLLEVIRSIRPPLHGLRILGSDYEEGLEWQLLTLGDCLESFIGTEWVKYENGCSPEFRSLMNDWNAETKLARQFRRDLVSEFSVVMGGEGIQTRPGDRDRYIGLTRSGQWLPMVNKFELGSVYEVYASFLRRIQTENYVTTDQFMLESLNWLRGFEWGTLRGGMGYDVMFVDELHLFSQLERTALHYLGRDSENYPRIFMSLDPRQSPTGRYGNFVEDQSMPETQDTVELREIYRYSPEILRLIQHIDRSAPTENFGNAWSVNLSDALSRAEAGPMPTAIRSDFAMNDEATFAIAAAQKLQSQYDRVAVIVLDEGQEEYFISRAEAVAENSSHVYPIRDRDESLSATKSKRCLTIGLSDYLAGLQFDAVVVAGLGDSVSTESSEHKKIRFVSRLYLAVSRSSREVQFLLGRSPTDDPEIIKSAIDHQLITVSAG